MDLEELRGKLTALVESVSRIFVGNRDTITILVYALLAEGHALIEGPPGTGKTLLAKTLAMAISGSYRRIQGHVDIMPSDITGFHVYTLSGESRFVQGPIFANVVLVDELNRINPRSQASILEAMQEKHVTVDGVTYDLPRPNFIIGTQVPVDEPGSIYGIILTLRDRFTVSATLDYAPVSLEAEIITRSDATWGREPEVVPVADARWLLEAKSWIESKVYTSPRIVEYIAVLSKTLREHPSIAWGPSHRVSVDAYRLARVAAVADGRDYVVPDDVKLVYPWVARHRITLSRQALSAGRTPDDVIEEVINNVPVPREK